MVRGIEGQLAATSPGAASGPVFIGAPALQLHTGTLAGDTASRHAGHGQLLVSGRRRARERIGAVGTPMPYSRTR